MAASACSHAEEGGGGEAEAGGDALLLGSSILHVLELVEARAEDVVRDPAKHGMNAPKMMMRARDAVCMSSVAVRLLGHAEAGGGEAEAARPSSWQQPSHVLKLVETRADVVRGQARE